MYVNAASLRLVGCTFLDNSAPYDSGEDTVSYSIADDIHIYESIVNIDVCPAGFSGAAGATLDIFNYDGTITGEAKSYQCGACVR